MSTSQVTVIARLRALPGKERQLESALRALVQPTRIEDGCLNYDLHVNISEAGDFFFHENWSSEAALDAHLRSPHLDELRRIAPELIAGEPEIFRCIRLV